MSQESTSPASAAPISPEIIRQTVAAYFATIRAMDADAFVATFATDGVSHDPVGAPPHEGHAAIRQFFEGIAGLFDVCGLTEDQVFVAGNGAAVKWTGHGRGKNGVEVTFEGVDVIELNDAGKIQVVHAYWDPAPVLSKVRSS
ncbi:MAG: nuclear transport factor 2 family protein [Ktedonobacterales bacterium]|nr:nuclear transport factor 2 family protein [Ktedonobacterales bacterium]